MNDRVPLQKSQEEQAEEHKKTEDVVEVGRNDVKVSSYMDDLSYHNMAEFFELSFDKRDNIHIAEKISFLADWAKEKTGSDDQLDQKMAIKTVIKGLGLPMVGTELIEKLYRWTRLDQNKKRIEKEMETMI